MSDTTERLTAQQIEGQLTAALSTIETLWPRMLTLPSRRPGQRTKGTGVTLADDAVEVDDTPRIVQVVDVRREVTHTLRSWCQVIVEDHNAQHGIPSGTDVPGMARFLTRWSYLAAEHEAALDMLDEVKAARRDVERYAPPSSPPPPHWAPRPRTMRLGSCPLTWQDPEDAADKPCPGTLRGDEEGWVRCTDCGTAAVMGWWEQHLSERVALMTLDEVRVYLHRQHGMRLTLSALRMWVQRGHLAASGTNAASREVYDVGAVEAALTRRERMPRTV